MLRTRLLRTSSFRLALVYAALSGVSFLILLGVIFLSTARFMRHQIDDIVTSEINEILSDAHSRSLADLGVVVNALARHPAGFHYLLQDSAGHVVAGNERALDPQEGVREWSDSPRQGHRHGRPYAALRGRGVRLPEGYLFVGWSTHQVTEMEEMVVGTFAWGLGASIALALAGGLWMSGRLMSRIETVSNTSRNIIGEDLQQRLPVTEADDELDHLAVSINTMLDRIQALMQDLRQVTTNIAHDLRTPLTRLRQRLELASLPQADVETIRTTLSSTVQEIDSILSIFAALLHIAQLEAGTGRAGFKAVDLSGLLATSVELYRPMADEKGQTLAEDVEESLTVQGERELLMQLFANLIENALRHSPRGSSVAIVARKTNDWVTVSVVDNGPGIPENMRTKVLQRFVRLESSRTTPGSGLGLSLANAIVKAHEATLELSDAGPGLRATVSLKTA